MGFGAVLPFLIVGAVFGRKDRITNTMHILFRRPSLVPTRGITKGIHSVIHQMCRLHALVISITKGGFRRMTHRRDIRLHVRFVSRRRSAFFRHLSSQANRDRGLSHAYQFNVLRARVFTVRLQFPNFVTPYLSSGGNGFQPPVTQVFRFIGGGVLGKQVNRLGRNRRVVLMF